MEGNPMFKILVVEDDRELNKTVCSFLNHSGYVATGCVNANEAYDALYDAVFDLIVSDIMMPGIDGFEVCRRIRAMEEDGSVSYWEVLFKANSFADLLDRLNMIQEINAADQRRLADIAEAAQYVASAQMELTSEKTELEAVRVELDAFKKTEITKPYKKKYKLLQKIVLL